MRISVLECVHIDVYACRFKKARNVITYIVVAYMVMAYIGMAYIVVAYMVMAYIVMAYVCQLDRHNHIGAISVFAGTPQPYRPYLCRP